MSAHSGWRAVASRGIGVAGRARACRLEAFDRRKAQILELHCFGGLTCDKMAAVMALSACTIDTELRFAKAWLPTQLA